MVLEPTAAQDASHPFGPLSDPENPPDVILRSSDVVDFHAHKALLAFGSVMFRNMFTFPAPPVPQEGDIMKDGKPVVPLTESGKTLEKLLILCYPRYSSYGFHDLDGIDGAYEAAQKYQISGGQKQIEHVLEGFVEKEPHRVFAIACHRGLEKLAKAVAIETLKNPRYLPNISVPEFKLISAHRLRQLEDFHFRCSESMSKLVGRLGYYIDHREYDYWQGQPKEHPETQYTEVWWSREGHSADCGVQVEGNSYFVEIGPAKWFADHISAVESAIPLSPDATSVSKKLAEISGPTVAAMSKCSKCPTSAPLELSNLATGVESEAKEAYRGILAEFSFTAE